MSDNVFFEVTSYGAGKVTLCANKSLPPECVILCVVSREVSSLSTRIVAPQRLFSGMGEHVHLKVISGCKREIAQCAIK